MFGNYLFVFIFSESNNIYWEREIRLGLIKLMNGNGGRTHGRRPAERDRLLRREIRFVDSIIGGVARLDGEKVLCESAINFVGARYHSQARSDNNCG